MPWNTTVESASHVPGEYTYPYGQWLLIYTDAILVEVVSPDLKTRRDTCENKLSVNAGMSTLLVLASTDR